MTTRDEDSHNSEAADAPVPDTYDRLPSGLLQGRNPWHPPDLDETLIDYRRQDDGSVQLTYGDELLGTLREEPNGWVAEVAGRGPLRAHPGHERLTMPQYFGSNQQADQALRRATATYRTGDLVAFEQQMGRPSYGQVVRHERERGTIVLTHSRLQFEVPAHSVIGRDNRPR